MSKGISTGGFHDIPTTVNLASPIIDWAQGNVFSAEISADTTFSFLNDTDGRTVVVKIKNTTASSLNLTWPSSVISPNPFIGANVTKMVTLIKIGDNVYMASTEL